MHILLFSAQFGNPYQGGHVSSMLTIGNELIKNNLIVTIGLPLTLKQNNQYREIYNLFPEKNIVWLPTTNIFYDKILLTKHIASLIKKHKIEILHSFDLDSHIIARFCAHKLNYKIKVVGNICGMTMKYKYPYASPVIVFSQELKKQMENIFKNCNYEIFLEPSRIDLSFYSNHIKKESNLSYLKTYLNDKKNILMISRFSFTKFNSIIWTLKAINQLAYVRNDFCFILVGSVNANIVYKYIKNKIEKINKDHNKEIIVLDNNLSKNIKNIIPVSDIVIGVAKVCFEGMLNKKPVIVVGEHGCSGIIDTDAKTTFDNMIYNNFSSREIIEKRGAPQKIYSEIIKLLDNKNICLKLGNNGNKWIKNNLDIANGIGTYISTYQNLMKQKKQQFLPLGYAFYGFIITFLGKFKGYIKIVLLSIEFYSSKKYSD